uniref:Uncharacterized protein n=1 Tax=Avena sativa TaxID=4498 RepID=A0ACD5TA56_AVESA
MQEQGGPATSSRPRGERPIWRLIWKCPVPPKVKNLAWRISCNALATQVNLRRRGIKTPDECRIYGQGSEDSYHAFVLCPHARILWQTMREVWSLPDDNMLKNTGQEWFLHILSRLSELHQASMLRLLWRIWHVHNKITHDKPAPSMEGSRRFLVSYMNSSLVIKKCPDADVAKGKMVVAYEEGFCARREPSKDSQKARLKWKPREAGTMKLKINMVKPVLMVLRDQTGQVIFAACRQLRVCRDATEAKLEAMEEGLKLAMHWTPEMIVMESDCSEVLSLVKSGNTNSSVYAFKILSIRELVQERDTFVC